MNEKAMIWVVAATPIIGALVRLVKDDRFVAWFPVEIPPKYRAWLALGLGVVSGVLQALLTGATWPAAIVGGLVSSLGAISGHELVVEGVRNGRDIGVPKVDGAS